MEIGSISFLMQSFTKLNSQSALSQWRVHRWFNIIWKATDEGPTSASGAGHKNWPELKTMLADGRAADRRLGPKGESGVFCAGQGNHLTTTNKNIFLWN